LKSSEIIVLSFRPTLNVAGVEFRLQAKKMN